MKRFAALHICPVFCNFAQGPSFAAFSKSESSRTMKASLPPSSKTDFLIFFPANAATVPPAFSLPVRLTPLTNGFSKISWISLCPILKFWKIFFGKPASEKAFSISSPLSKHIDACFRTTTFPARIVGITNLRTCQNGKFQGITPRIIPIGS